MNTITRNEAERKIRNTNGKIFTVVFTKRTTGERREMNCRMKVKKHLKGGGPAYNFKKKNLISVYDLGKEGYRCIPIEGITHLRVGGKSFKVEDWSFKRDLFTCAHRYAKKLKSFRPNATYRECFAEALRAGWASKSMSRTSAAYQKFWK